MLGLYNKDSRRILAREVNDIATPQKIVIGVISNIDKENYEITLTNEKGNKVVFEIQDITKTLSFSEDTLSKSGFSKIQNFYFQLTTPHPTGLSYLLLSIIAAMI